MTMKLPRIHLVWTSVVGLAAVVYLFIRLDRSNALDGVTAVVLAIVSVLWIVLQGRSLYWQWRLPLALPDIPDHLRIKLGTDLYLPDGTSSELAAGAIRARGAPGWIGLGSTTLISLGLAGTFLGLTLGLFDRTSSLMHRGLRRVGGTQLGGQPTGANGAGGLRVRLGCGVARRLG